MSRLLRLPQVIERVGLSRSSIYNHIKAGRFPRQVKLGERSSAWIEAEIEDWVNERIQESRQANA